MYKSPIKFDEQIHQVVLPFEKSQGGDVDAMVGGSTSLSLADGNLSHILLVHTFSLHVICLKVIKRNMKIL